MTCAVREVVTFNTLLYPYNYFFCEFRRTNIRGEIYIQNRPVLGEIYVQGFSRLDGMNVRTPSRHWATHQSEGPLSAGMGRRCASLLGFWMRWSAVLFRCSAAARGVEGQRCSAALQRQEIGLFLENSPKKKGKFSTISTVFKWFLQHSAVLLQCRGVPLQRCSAALVFLALQHQAVSFEKSAHPWLLAYVKNQYPWAVSDQDLERCRYCSVATLKNTLYVEFAQNWPFLDVDFPLTC